MADDSRQPVTGYPVHPYTPPQPSDGYFQQQYAAYAYPAPPHLQPPPPTYYVDQERRDSLRCVITGITAALILICVVTFITWLVLRPKFPEFRVDSATVTGFNVTDYSLSGAWDFRVSVSNPNKKFSIVFEEVDSDLSYSVFSIADNTLAPFTLGKRNASTIRVSFAASESYLGDGVKWVLARDRSDDGFVGFDVRIYSWVEFDGGLWRVRKQVLKVLCHNVSISIGSSSSGNMTGGSKGCIVGW
ncbi:hypothetical protein QQ045_029613 [Rhodiola kirilowii]